MTTRIAHFELDHDGDLVVAVHSTDGPHMHFCWRQGRMPPALEEAVEVFRAACQAAVDLHLVTVAPRIIVPELADTVLPCYICETPVNVPGGTSPKAVRCPAGTGCRHRVLDDGAV